MPENSNNKWTPEEDIRLKSLIEANVSIDLIAAKLKRTTQAVKWRANALGISIKGTGRAEGEEVRSFFAWPIL